MSLSGKLSCGDDMSFRAMLQFFPHEARVVAGPEVLAKPTPIDYARPSWCCPLSSGLEDYRMRIFLLRHYNWRKL
jgi:hypothetical protein